MLNDVHPIQEYLEKNSCLKNIPRIILINMVVPTYHVPLDYLKRICSLAIPDNLQSTFIIVVDNLSELLCIATKLGHPNLDVNQAALELEKFLVDASKAAHNSPHGNNVWVHCNKENQGASASQNRGLDENAEYILFLDDDMLPELDLLLAYSVALEQHCGQVNSNIIGLVGLLQFPHLPNLAVTHAAVLMSYLTFMFEIAENLHYKQPAWGVMAYLLVKRTRICFDTAYAKTGGGKDVDFCLCLTESRNS